MIQSLKKPLFTVSNAFWERNAASDSTRRLLEYFFQLQPVRIYIDTCTLLDENSGELLSDLEAVMTKYHATLFVLRSVMNELAKVSRRDKEKFAIAAAAQHQLWAMYQKGLICFAECGDDDFSDINFITRFIFDTVHTSNVVLLSQDHKLTNVVLGLNDFIRPCVETQFDVYVARLTNGNGLQEVTSRRQGAQAAAIF